MEYTQKVIESLMRIIFHYKSLYLENVIAVLLVITFYIKNLISQKRVEFSHIDVYIWSYVN